MILLDTNVVSELRKAAAGRANPAVHAWASTYREEEGFLSVVSIMELRKGILLRGRSDPAQAAALNTWLDNDLLPSFGARILPVDVDIAMACAALHVPNRRSDLDALIAATAIVHRLTLATRNTRDFAGTGVRLVNPWNYRVGAGSGPE